jgi:putative heme-binding domain-containing protein
MMMRRPQSDFRLAENARHEPSINRRRFGVRRQAQRDPALVLRPEGTAHAKAPSPLRSAGALQRALARKMVIQRAVTLTLAWIAGSGFPPASAQNPSSPSAQNQPANSAAIQNPANQPGPASAPRPQSPRAFEFLDGDRVVLIGDTLIEREQLYGYVETRLLARYPDRKITFRNLGWSADTPLGASRMSFDWLKPEEEWLKSQLAQVAAVKPTVAIVGYGMASSFAGEAGLAKFKTDLTKLIEGIQAQAKEKSVRFILLSPIRHEALPPPLADPAKHNAVLALYTQAIREIAEAGGHQFISLFDLLPDGLKFDPPLPLTDNGIHLNGVGYWTLAETIDQGLGWIPAAWRLGFTREGQPRRGSQFIKVEDVVRTDTSIRFKATADFLEYMMAPGDDSVVPRRTPPNLLQFMGIKAGTYLLRIDGHALVGFDAADWSRGQRISGGPPQARTEQLRQTVIKKNELFFHRWRPQNQTYLFGFRKYEQGQNAREIPMFDPLIEEQEKKIAELVKPLRHTYELLTPEEAASTPPPAPAPKTDAAAPPAASPNSTRATPGTAESSAFQTQPRPNFQVADGFEVQLFAENPQLAKPIQMNFDPQGRLWIASSSVYPQIRPGQVANDKILVIEDTDGDGKADKSTVFAEGLLIPTGVEPGDGGAYVGQSTELFHFKDLDGDGRADQKRVVLSGFGTEDTHHIIHTLRWAHDGQLYFNQSIYIHSHIETPHGVVRLNSGGILRLRPPTMELGIHCKGWVNSWGHDFDAFGQSFVTDGAGSSGINLGVPGAMYVTYEGARRILGGVSPGSYPKFCGLEIVRSSHFPADWQGNLITCDFRAHRVVRFAINEQGSAYVTKEMPDVLRTADVTFRPIDVKLGPDGALYVADWSNPIIQHGEVDFRDPRRDHEHGRIWRVTAKGRALAAKPKLKEAAHDELLAQLVSPNAFNQRQARRVLTERGPSIAPNLASWTQAQASEKALLEALWMYQSIDTPEPALLEKVLSAKDGQIRAAAVRVAGYWRDRLKNPVELLSRAIADEHPRVRLEAMRALSLIPTARSAELVLSALDKPMDPPLDYGVWLSINDLAKPWIDAVQSGAWKIEGRERQLEFGLRAIEPALAGSVLGRLLETRSIPRDGSGPWIDLIGQAGSPKELRLLFDSVLERRLDESATTRALAALAQAARTRNAKPSGDLAPAENLLAHSNPGVRAQAIRLAGSWRLARVAPRILGIAGDTSASSAVQQAAFESLRELGGSEVIQGLDPLTAKSKPAAIRREAARTLAALNLEKAMPRVIDVLSDASNEEEALALWRSILSNTGAASVAARALAKAKLSASAAKAGLRAAREGGRDEPNLVLALALSGNLEEAARDLTPAEIQQMAASVKDKGDPARGEAIYRRADLNCLGCHAIGGVGGKVGPDMTSLGASAQIDYLIESLLYPNRKVKEGYHSTVIETKDGQEFSGVLVRETGAEVIVRDATNREVAVPANNIQRRTMGGSIMPSGLLDVLTRDQQIDLYRFLSELGKPGRFDASKGNVARFWKLFAATIDAAQFGDERVLKSDLTDRDWIPAISFVDGRLLREELDAKLKSAAGRHPSAVYAAARFQVSKSGPVRLELTAKPYVALWIDGRPVSAASPIQTELSAGTHTFVIKVDARNLPDEIRLATADGTFLTE